MIDDLLERFRRYERLALSRLVSLVASGAVGPEILPRLPSPVRPSRVVAITGSGGVGKSSLLGKLIELPRAQYLTVAVLASDPQSTLTGGALLGDRFRMNAKLDDGVFIRSLAAISGHGAVADHLDLLCRVVESFGFDVIFLETVGSGQGDVAVYDFADIVALLLQPEAGDELQWEKAGILEVADLLVVNKADLPGAEQTVGQIRNALDLSHQHNVPVLAASARTGQGLAELWQAIQSVPPRRRTDPARAKLLRLAHQIVSEKATSKVPRRPPPSMLVVACFSRHPEALAWAEEQLRRRYGPVALTSRDFDFVQTQYYESTMGPGLKKRFLAFADLIDPATLADAKIHAIGLEGQLAASGQFPDIRPLNLDPGLLQLGKFLLATTKDQAHRIYLRDGIFAEVTLRFHDGAFDLWPWTYRDYREPAVRAFLEEARDLYRQLLKGRR